ncbi:MAG: type IV toxin-antitoxin system AbiEi family antitoxin domain-containing protein [Acidobacteria bacterium]|nr:type IV toxin-antitoxin system AbiEi family antitoxin domain-containing protein [Acidobacteriota bacterium]
MRKDLVNVTARRGSPEQRAIAVARRQGIARTRDFETAGIARTALRRMCDRGLLVRTARGLYQVPNAELSAAHSLAETARVAPGATVCLLSALQFHELTTQLPRAVWILIGSKAWTPRNPPVPLEIVRSRGDALTAGIARHVIERVSVPITVPAKTVADCFKYRNRVGLDVAMEALRDCLRHRRATVDELWRFASVCRVRNVMRPYLEAMV